MKAAILSIYMSPTNVLVAYAIRERVAGGERVSPDLPPRAPPDLHPLIARMCDPKVPIS